MMIRMTRLSLTADDMCDEFDDPDEDSWLWQEDRRRTRPRNIDPYDVPDAPWDPDEDEDEFDDYGRD